MVLGHVLGNITSTLFNMEMQMVLSEAKFNGVISRFTHARYHSQESGRHLVKDAEKKT